MLFIPEWSPDLKSWCEFERHRGSTGVGDTRSSRRVSADLPFQYLELPFLFGLTNSPDTTYYILFEAQNDHSFWGLLKSNIQHRIQLSSMVSTVAPKAFLL